MHDDDDERPLERITVTLPTEEPAELDEEERLIEVLLKWSPVIGEA